MTQELLLLTGTAASIGFIHTLLGPDHYLPFIALSKAGKWNTAKTLVITVLCGLGHVLSSIALGLAGILLGTAVFKLEAFEALRGDMAALLLIIFGFFYTVWGARRAYLNRPHEHTHFHAEGEEHTHSHSHHAEHAHPHAEKKSMTPWILFIIFIFGPCEPLIPLIMYPAAKHNLAAVLMVASVFSIVTISTMTGLVLALGRGIERIQSNSLERYSHALAGFAILACGLSIKFLGL